MKRPGSGGRHDPDETPETRWRTTNPAMTYVRGFPAGTFAAMTTWDGLRHRPPTERNY
ncbi:hypothetical protein GCM10023191_016100 [Actinoallomurus oryzae]|uniref:Uncharacterized protein n=1 Tax=Actinoallomurus oryzae TaxID=502180 RepID=A0ABP8PJX0_9ACTN